MAKAVTKAGPMPVDNRRTLVTPEGVDLGVELATHGARAGAFLIDLAIMTAVLFLLLLVAGLFSGALEEVEGIPAIIFLLGSFLLRSAWFTLWEMTPRAATPGKRMMRIRVAMRSGGRLTPDAIIARNLTRELELFLPVSMMFSSIGAALGLTGVGGALATIAGLIWCFIFVMMPMFNRDRLRAGDLIGGTWVVEAPRPKLEPDLAADAAQHVGRFNFSKEQIDAYGEKELHVLEEVIRRYDKRIAADVARRIREKIRWEGGEPDIDFLRAYYAALRRKLEQGMLFGKRKKDKFDKKG
jgi:uncharacterized RDD family membrane protein YckC